MDFTIALWILYGILIAIWLVTLYHQAIRKKGWWVIFTAIIPITVLVYWIVYWVNPKFRGKR